jgi:hypothetical protein
VIDVLSASCSSLPLRLPLLFRPFLLNEIVYFPLHLILLEYQISAGGFERGYPFVWRGFEYLSFFLQKFMSGKVQQMESSASHTCLTS